MKRLFQTLLAAIGVLGVVVVAAVVYVTTFLDPEDFKPRLIEVVEEHSGLELTMEGPLAWSFYPRLGVSVESVESRLPEQEDEAPFLAFERAEVSLAFAPLLRREIAIEGLTLDGMQLRLERDAEGRGNWEPLLQRLDERREGAESVLAPATAGPSPSFPGGGNLAVALNIASVQVRNGEVLLRDLGEEREWLLEGLNLSGTNVNPARAFPLRTSFRVASYGALDWRELERPPGLSSEVSLESRVHLDLAERRYRLEGPKLNTTTRLDEVEGRQTLNLSGRELLLELSERRMRLEDGKLEASLQHPELGEQAVALSLAFVLDADLAEHTAQLRKLQLSGPDDLRLSGNLNLAGLDAAPTYSGHLSLAPLSLRPWLTRLGRLPVTADSDALSDVALTSPVRGDLSRLELSSLTLVLDDSTFTGRLAMGFAGDDLSVDLQGDRLDLDAYLPPPEGGPDTASRGGFFAIGRAHADDPAPLVPAEWLSALRLNGSLALGQLRLMGLDFTEVELALAGDNGRHRLEGFRSRLYGGELDASGELDLTREPIRWQLAPTLSRVRLEPLTQALARSEEPAPMRGRLTVDGQLESRGNSGPQLRRNLDGRLNGHIDEGAVLNVNISEELCTTVAALEGRETTREWSPDTRFDRAEASVRINGGVARSDDILLTLPGIELGGEGELDLVTERFDLRAAARFVDSADAACRVNPRLERVPLPVRCSGSYLGDSREWCRFDREAFQASLVELLRDEAEQRGRDEIERRLERPLEQLDERLGEGAGQELRDALRGLFN
ncbi:AsmA family protein [Halomonas campisalis]|uniref:AsmA family protein n=1 Tax=Billgrantia campisalis TaxID=74661 RepID=A0ABS9PEY1_9GAMM|nr:AsmA family protein [Halomonas campisalis]MCG6659812.1 AsmA family protein [Halomonas campisalis]MDR5864998.1 AsmA family protein [Halomonas campisalis]